MIAYESDASGRPEICVRPFAGAAMPARISSDGGTKPRWTRDGIELLFLAPGGRVMSAAMKGGVPAGPPRLLFQSTSLVDLEPSADGSRILWQVVQQPPDVPVHLMTNWTARLAE